LASQHCNFLGMIPVESEDISMASFKDLWPFARDTRVMNLCWNCSIGLHNKPKAEALLEFFLTDPFTLKKNWGRYA
jgi:hypothetical protein